MGGGDKANQSCDKRLKHSENSCFQIGIEIKLFGNFIWYYNSKNQLLHVNRLIWKNDFQVPELLLTFDSHCFCRDSYCYLR